MNNMLQKVVLCAAFITLSVAAAAQDAISLATKWHVTLDPDSVGVEKKYYLTQAGQPIELPGTLDEAGYGQKTSGADYGILSRKHKHIGPAWYNLEIQIPKSWAGAEVELYIERAMWRTQAWVDGQMTGTQDGLGTPHLHNLGALKPGKHLLSVCVNNDMIYNIGDKGHCYGEYTQIIWNGMLGQIELRPVRPVSLTQPKVWPNAKQKLARLTFDIHNKTKSKNAKLRYTITDLSSNKVVAELQEKVALADTLIHHSADVVLAENPKLWDEYTPNLYSVDVVIESGKIVSKTSSTFGFRDLSTSKSKILVNGNPTFMRGNLDCVHFPLTGYPSCDVAEWEKIFKIYKDHGMNHVRFHSWCPPTAAFEAADRLGIYIQAEVLWIDWWMAIINPERPEMTTKGLPKGMGHNPSADTFVQAELARMVEAYGNHPSFAMLCIGNELGNSDFEVMQPWIEEIKAKDNRRLYSVSTARRIMPVDQYMITHNIPNVGGTYGLRGKGTNFDLEQNYSKANIPIIAHELGQYPVYPRWSEIDKYTGVLEARNLMELKQLAEKNGLVDMDGKFHEASGALQTILYKALLENLYRTSSCAGFSMLSMTDYSGQGEALIGWLDSFWDSKGIVAPETFKQYSNSVVLLARFDKYVWNAGEPFTARLQMANYSLNSIEKPMRWSLTDSKGTIVAQGVVDAQAKQGILNDVGTAAFDMPRVAKAEKFSFAISCDAYRNDWSLWVFPSVQVNKGEVLVAERYDAEVQKRLEQGGKVLLLAQNLGTEEHSNPIHFNSLFWSNSFFPGQSNKTLGLYIDENHPALAKFPTDNHTDWQWQSMSTGRSFNFNAHPGLKPIVQPISDFHISDRLASVFECRVGSGSLLVCGHSLNDTIVEAKTLKSSLLDYMNSADFRPTYSIDNEELKALFYAVPMVETALPQGFEQSVLYVSAGGQKKESGSSSWSKKLDKITKQDKGCNYTVACDDVYRDAQGVAWTGREITIEIKTPNGILGDLYVKLEDWNKQGRQGLISIEGRESAIKKISPKGQWIKLFVMREDTNDGKITFKARATEGGNLMISEIALIKSE